jgi:cytochrome d ubiquinol oxidase subunit I
MKLAAIEGMWETHQAPCTVHRLSAFPTRRRARRTMPVEIPWVMGLIGTRSLTEEIPGINELVEDARSASARHHRL